MKMKTGLKESQIRLLKEGPTQLAQAWLLQAMPNDYKDEGLRKIIPRKTTDITVITKGFFEKPKTDESINPKPKKCRRNKKNLMLLFIPMLRIKQVSQRSSALD